MTKKILTVALIIFGLGFAGLARAEEINNFDVTAHINKDSTVNIEERIVYDFGTENKHGIFRDIPIKYKARGGNFSLRIHDVSVADENNQPYNFTVSYPGNDIEIKIGDANELVTGIKTYVITYTVDRAINYFSDHDEFYWNATGNEWQVYMDKPTAKVFYPEALKESDVKTDCFYGLTGETNTCPIIKNAKNAEGLVEAASFGYNEILGANQGLTFVVSIPKGMIIQPTWMQNFMATLMDNSILGLPILVFLGLLLYWSKFGRDPKGKGVIIAQYDVPDNLTPAEVGTIIDDKTQSKDISAEIINLAINGYLKIARSEKGLMFKTPEYTFTKLKEPDDLPNEFDKSLMAAIFSLGPTANLSDLKTKIYREIALVVDSVYNSVVSKGYFAGNPKKIRSVFYLIGGFVLYGGFYLSSEMGWLAAISMAISGVLIMIFGYVMPKKTQKGVDAKEYIEGLKLYLSVVEKDRIKFFNAPEKNPETFEKFLPYAMVLGVEKEWAHQFEGIYTQNPNWYSDTSGANFSALVFASQMSSFGNTAAASMATSPGGGSGFGGGSGGGGGGGGGGSW